MKTKASAEIGHFARQAAERYSALLHRYLARRMHSPEEIEDLVQEVYVRLLKIGVGEFVLNPRAYILRTAAHVAHDYAEKKRRARQYIVVSSDIVEQVAEAPVESLSCSLARRLSTHEQLIAALKKLAPIHTAVLLLHFREGYSYEEIAGRLCVSSRQVERYLANAKRELMAINWEWD